MGTYWAVARAALTVVLAGEAARSEARGGIVGNREGRLRIVASEAFGLSRDKGLGQPPAEGQTLDIQVGRGPGYVLVTVAGEIDIATVTLLREQLSVLAADGGLVVDLDQVDFIDAAGLGALAGLAREAAAHGGRLHVVCARRRTRQLFELTGLDQTVPLARTLAEAIGPVTEEPGWRVCEM
jgi:anti-sigma B factor antagonist